MSTSARKFTATTDAITITPLNTLAGALGFAYHFAFQLAAGSTTLGGSNPDFGLILSQWTNLSGANDILLLAYCDSTNPLGRRPRRHRATS